MRKVIIFIVIILVIIAIAKNSDKEEGSIITHPPSNQPPVTKIGETKHLISKTGGRLDWSDSANLLVFDKLDSSNYARIWTMDREGGNQKCLTCNNTSLPQKHQGNPDWHPSGKFIVFQAADPALGGIFSGTALHDLIISPGAGAQNNVWIMDAAGTKFWQITRLNNQGGVLHPHFSHDGSKLMWAEKIDGTDVIGQWVIKLADFSERNGEPRVTNVRSLTPGNLRWYETHDFSADGSTILFSGMIKGGNESDFDIYTYNLNDKTLKQLTGDDEKQWDEHAHFHPNGKQIIWMSSADIPNVQHNQLGIKTDYWIMNIDGSDKRRLTFFNNNSPTRMIASDLTISADGQYLFGYVQDPGRNKEPGSIIRIKLAE